MNCDFLTTYKEDALGPVQQAEAFFLYAFIKVVQPKLVVEIGAARGHSTRCFLEGGAERVVSIDVRITNELKLLAASFPGILEIIQGGQENFPLVGIHECSIDVLFIDASHNFELDCQTFTRVKPYLDSGATVLVHDTGVWQKRFMLPHHFRHIERHGVDCGDVCAHQPGVLRFANWLKAEGLQAVSLESKNCIRHGISLFQLSR